MVVGLISTAKIKLGWALTIVALQDLEAISALENIAENSKNNTIYLTKY